jgi:hypothetical protein
LARVLGFVWSWRARGRPRPAAQRALRCPHGSWHGSLGNPACVAARRTPSQKLGMLSVNRNRCKADRLDQASRSGHAAPEMAHAHCRATSRRLLWPAPRVGPAPVRSLRRSGPHPAVTALESELRVPGRGFGPSREKMRGIAGGFSVTWAIFPGARGRISGILCEFSGQRRELPGGWRVDGMRHNASLL